MTGRGLAGLAAAAAGLYLVTLFLPWSTPGDDGPVVARATGWDTIASFGAFPAVALVLWEALRLGRVSTGMRSPALLSFFLAAATAFFGVGALVQLRWSSRPFFAVESVGDFRYGAWLALVASLVLLAASAAALAEHRRATGGRDAS